MTHKFGKQVHLQDLTRIRLINHAVAGDVITSRSRYKLKLLCLRYQSVDGHQTWQHDNLP